LCLSAALFSFTNARIIKQENIRADSSIHDLKHSEASLNNILYDSLGLSGLGLSKEALDLALKGYESLLQQGVVNNSQFLSIIDFSQSSRNKRFYLLDVKNQKLVKNTFVAHGKNSGVEQAEKFSNKLNSFQSSLGFYLTKATYIGKRGFSLRLAGLDKGFNNNAEVRGVVMHGSSYVSEERAINGFVGRSQGCPALPESDYIEVINYIKDGSVLFIYHPTEDYTERSTVLTGAW
jgi:hypothetical protein